MGPCCKKSTLGHHSFLCQLQYTCISDFLLKLALHILPSKWMISLQHTCAGWSDWWEHIFCLWNLCPWGSHVSLINFKAICKDEVRSFQNDFQYTWNTLIISCTGIYMQPLLCCYKSCKIKGKRLIDTRNNLAILSIKNSHTAHHKDVICIRHLSSCAEQFYKVIKLK